MKHRVNEHGNLQYGSYCDIGSAPRHSEKIWVLNKQGLCSVLYYSAMVLVLAVFGMAAAGVSLSISIEIGIAAEAVMMAVLLVLALTTSVFEVDNRT